MAGRKETQMIKAELDRNSTHIEATGSIGELATEIGLLINSFYATIRGEEEKATFKHVMQAIMEDEAPTWHVLPHGTGVYVELPTDGREEEAIPEPPSTEGVE